MYGVKAITVLLRTRAHVGVTRGIAPCSNQIIQQGHLLRARSGIGKLRQLGCQNLPCGGLQAGGLTQAAHHPTALHVGQRLSL